MIEADTYLRQMGLMLDEDARRDALSVLLHRLMDLDVSRVIDAGHYERRGSRMAYRNGYRQRTWHSQIGAIRLHIPKLRRGTYYPDFLSAEVEDRLLSLIDQAYLSGVELQAVERLLDAYALLLPGEDSAGDVAELLQGLVARYRTRSLNGAYPYLWLEVTDVWVNKDGVRRKLVVAVGQGRDGTLTALDFELTASADEIGFWRAFLRRLVDRGLRGVRLITSDSYSGVKVAVRDVLEADWQYSRTHVVERVLREIPADDRAVIADGVSAIFLQSSHSAAVRQMRQMVRDLRAKYPEAAHLLSVCGRNALTFMQYPEADWVMIAAADVTARVKQALGSPTDAVAIFGDGLNGLEPVYMESQVLLPTAANAPGFFILS